MPDTVLGSKATIVYEVCPHPQKAQSFENDGYREQDRLRDGHWRRPAGTEGPFQFPMFKQQHL